MQADRVHKAPLYCAFRDSCMQQASAESDFHVASAVTEPLMRANRTRLCVCVCVCVCACVSQEGGVLVGVAAYSCLDRNPPPPSLIVTVSSRMDDKDLDTIATALRKAAAAVL